MTGEGGSGARRLIALQGALQRCGHRVLGRQRSAGARAEWAGPAGPRRGAPHSGHCARRRCSFRSRSAPGGPGRVSARAGACGVPGPGRHSPRAHLSRPARPLPACARPTQLATREAQAAESLPPRGAKGRERLGGRVGGRSRGRRLCAGVAGASQADWWRVLVGAGPWGQV